MLPFIYFYEIHKSLIFNSVVGPQNIVFNRNSRILYLIALMHMCVNYEFSHMPRNYMHVINENRRQSSIIDWMMSDQSYKCYWMIVRKYYSVYN